MVNIFGLKIDLIQVMLYGWMAWIVLRLVYKEVRYFFYDTNQPDKVLSTLTVETETIVGTDYVDHRLTKERAYNDCPVEIRQPAKCGYCRARLVNEYQCTQCGAPVE